MMESQEIEPLPVGQVHDRGLVGMRSQPEFGEFVFEHGESPVRLGARAAHDHEIICVAHELPVVGITEVSPDSITEIPHP